MRTVKIVKLLIVFLDMSGSGAWLDRRKVTHVKSIYLLNVVKQKSFKQKTKQATYCPVTSKAPFIT